MSVHMTWPTGCWHFENVVGLTTVPWKVPSDRPLIATAPPLNDHTPSISLVPAAATPVPSAGRAINAISAHRSGLRSSRRAFL